MRECDLCSDSQPNMHVRSQLSRLSSRLHLGFVPGQLFGVTLGKDKVCRTAKSLQADWHQNEPARRKKSLSARIPDRDSARVCNRTLKVLPNAALVFHVQNN